MADCHDLFEDYLDEIRLHKSKRDSLQTSRSANRDRIREHFKTTLKRPVPLFHGQGSYMMFTGLNPLDNDYDVDDGVYLQGLGTDPTTWPSAKTVHSWIVDAVKDYTQIPVKDKPRCVRVNYGAGYHVDLPIYAMNASNVPLIFDTSATSPYESDPRAFTNWFKERVKPNTQMRDIVRYLKGWRDYQQGATKVASGLAITILTANHFQADDRDDESLVKTVSAIYSYLYWGGAIQKPVTPYENLSAGWTDTQRTNFLNKLKELKDKGQEALDKSDKSAASKIWQGLLGDRFPIVESAPDESGGSTTKEARTTAIPAILGYDGRSG